MNLNSILNKVQSNHIIYESFEKADQILNHSNYQNIMVSISGGADSDIILDICQQLQADVHYVFFNTGIEYQATLDHLDYLESHYGITIERIMAPVPVPLGVQEYGLPFLNKFVSTAIGSLEKHNFPFKEMSVEEMKDYPIGYAKWWNNKYRNEGFSSCQFDINYNKYYQ